MPDRAPMLAGKVAVVTGGASGIGKACALAMASEGAHVAVFDCAAEAARNFVAELTSGGFSAVFYAADVANEDDVRAAVSGVEARFGPIEILVNNAGIAMRHPVDEQDGEGWRRCLDVNLYSVFLCSKHAIPHMRERGGSVIHISSVTGITGVRNRAAYSASKGALVALTRNMAMDYARFRIRVNCVCPGFTRTPLAGALLSDPEREQRLIAMHPLNRLGEPEDIAHAVVFLASDRASWITGHALAVDGGFSAGQSGDI